MVTKDNEHFIALHYACFHGNKDLINLLMSFGANHKYVNKKGINMLHVAAQGDSPYSLAYFSDKGLDINQYDHEISTPLHWACFQNSFLSVHYLIAMGADLNV